MFRENGQRQFDFSCYIQRCYRKSLHFLSISWNFSTITNKFLFRMFHTEPALLLGLKAR